MGACTSTWTDVDRASMLMVMVRDGSIVLITDILDASNVML